MDRYKDIDGQTHRHRQIHRQIDTKTGRQRYARKINFMEIGNCTDDCGNCFYNR